MAEKMSEISLSLMASTLDEETAIRALIESFQEEYRHRVKLRILLWDTAWQELVKYSLYGDSPDISEVGTTWIGSLAGMNAIRSFTPVEIRSLGGVESFLPASWQSGILAGESNVWAIPWLSYASLLFFHKEKLNQAGIINLDSAFINYANFYQTLVALQESGINYPLALWTRQTRIVVHDAASFIWKEGGDFLSSDVKHVLFDQGNSLQGLCNYFSLGRFIHTASNDTPDFRFISGEAAVIISGPQLWQIQQRHFPESVHEWGIVQVPVIPYLGGSSLVVWKNTRQMMAVTDLIKFLTNFQYTMPESEHKNNFPARLRYLEERARTDEFHKLAIQAMMVSKAFPTSRLWGLVEENMFNILTRIWAEIIKNDHKDISSSIQRNIEPVARRMNLALRG
jgi:multiple sugar transport system substrate-binding protein